MSACSPLDASSKSSSIDIRRGLRHRWLGCFGLPSVRVIETAELARAELAGGWCAALLELQARTADASDASFTRGRDAVLEPLHSEAEVRMGVVAIDEVGVRMSSVISDLERGWMESVFELHRACCHRELLLPWVSVFHVRRSRCNSERLLLDEASVVEAPPGEKAWMDAARKPLSETCGCA
mmetsp:Transcript_72469/g.212629  ORF Transcript_72469/g.212629 Transcript_72469/m.212629 type:complete len:182 (-) Transcript_72469:272-817(-)